MSMQRNISVTISSLLQCCMLAVCVMSNGTYLLSSTQQLFHSVRHNARYITADSYCYLVSWLIHTWHIL